MVYITETAAAHVYTGTAKESNRTDLLPKSEGAISWLNADQLIGVSGDLDHSALRCFSPLIEPRGLNLTDTSWSAFNYYMQHC